MRWAELMVNVQDELTEMTMGVDGSGHGQVWY